MTLILVRHQYNTTTAVMHLVCTSLEDIQRRPLGNATLFPLLICMKWGKNKVGEYTAFIISCYLLPAIAQTWV